MKVRDVSLRFTNLGFGLSDDIGVAGSCSKGLVAFYDPTLSLDTSIDLGDLGVGWVLCGKESKQIYNGESAISLCRQYFEALRLRLSSREDTYSHDGEIYNERVTSTRKRER